MWRIRIHEVFAVLSVLGFVGELASSLYTEVIYWLPEYVWLGAMVLSVAAIYTGSVAVTTTEGRERGRAVAATIVGVLTMIGVMENGIYWLFVLPMEGGMAMGL